MVWLSFLVVLRSVALSYIKENKLLLMGHEFGVRESLYAFVLFRSMRTSKIATNC